MLRKIFGFDHCIKNIADTWITSSGYSITRMVPGAGKGIIVDSNNALSTPTGVSSGNVTQVGIDYSPFLVAGLTRIVVGYRLKQVVAGATGPLMVIGSVISGADALTVIDYGSMPAASKVLNAEAYLEFVFNLTANTSTAYLDGTSLGTVAIPTALANAIKTGKLITFINLSASGSTATSSVRDLYLLDNTTGDGFVDRLGGVSTYPVFVDSAEATPSAWTPSDGTSNMLATLTAPLPATATVDSPVDKSPLKLSLKANPPEGFNIKAVQLNASLVAKGNLTTLAKLELTQDGTTVRGTNIDVPKTATVNKTIATLPNAPDGNPWTVSKLDNTLITITPDIVG